MDALLRLAIIDGPVPGIVYALAAIALVALLVRRPTRRWLIGAGLAVVTGAAVGSVVWLVCSQTRVFGDTLPLGVLWPVALAFAAVALALASLFGTRWWRKLVAILAMVLFLLAGVIGVNGYYAINRTVGALLGIVVDNPVDLPTPGTAQTAAAGPLWQTWHPPADMPAKGSAGTMTIPATTSGFNARTAGIYLPPAALVSDPPPLPLVILMMGFPGNPDPAFAQTALDALAAKHDGLGPIVVVVDQIGTGEDPACADSAAYGNARSYVLKDTVAWAKANLAISQDPAMWTIAGYSNGGGCAITYGALEPTVFGSILDISGEEFPGSDDPQQVLTTIYGGDDAAFEASKPINIMNAAPKGTYDHTTVVFTYGGADATFGPAAKKVEAAARAVGMTTKLIEIPGAGHVGDAVTGGFAEGFAAMYPVWGLSKQ